MTKCETKSKIKYLQSDNVTKNKRCWISSLRINRHVWCYPRHNSRSREKAKQRIVPKSSVRRPPSPPSSLSSFIAISLHRRVHTRYVRRPYFRRPSRTFGYLVSLFPSLISRLAATVGFPALLSLNHLFSDADAIPPPLVVQRKISGRIFRE